ncbi:hypothetical protein [Haloarcula sp. JP-L23]|uniref:hypothetical protein n=1 Tax=Haloarcula sp. JP-L23 TaxID=2716717 RepID=UPI00140F4C3B|nr:hypothetical protein G9465_24905 [Haloarcula sp. JP-L23]
MIDLRTGVYNHPYATMVTTVFIFALVVTTLYFFNSILDGQITQPEFDRLIMITVILFVATIASWITAIILSSADL